LRPLAIALAALVSAACGTAPLSPAALDTRNDTCASCRMPVSDARLAAQVVAPHEEPLFFDDLGCLRAWLEGRPHPAKGAAAFVADHATKEWVPLARAVVTRVEALETPMGSHLIAHADAASRDGDLRGAGGEPVARASLFGPLLVSEARR
jgi:copper chaperone NosL